MNLSKYHHYPIAIQAACADDPEAVRILSSHCCAAPLCRLAFWLKTQCCHTDSFRSNFSFLSIPMDDSVQAGVEWADIESLRPTRRGLTSSPNQHQYLACTAVIALIHRAKATTVNRAVWLTCRKILSKRFIKSFGTALVKQCIIKFD